MKGESFETFQNDMRHMFISVTLIATLYFDRRVMSTRGKCKPFFHANNDIRRGNCHNFSPFAVIGCWSAAATVGVRKHVCHPPTRRRRRFPADDGVTGVDEG